MPLSRSRNHSHDDVGKKSHFCSILALALYYQHPALTLGSPSLHMNEQHPLNTLAPANDHNQPPLSQLASATKNNLLINLAPATLNVNELKASNIQAQAKPLWLEFPTNHMKACLALLSV
jgi:hypothetical protein